MENQSGPSVLSRRQQVIFEEITLKESAESYNRIMRFLCNASPEIKEVADLSEGLIFIDFPVDPGGVEAYWEEVREYDVNGLRQEQLRLINKKHKLISIKDTIIKMFSSLFIVGEDIDLPELISEEWEWDCFFEDYSAIWGLARRLPIENRLLVLHWRQSFHWKNEEVPEKSFINLLKEHESEAGRGRPPIQERWIARKQLAVQLLIDERRAYETPDDFFWDAAVEDEEWGFDKSSAQKYFQRRLGTHRLPSTVDEWRQLAEWWERELNAAMDSEWSPTFRT